MLLPGVMEVDPVALTEIDESTGVIGLGPAESPLPLHAPRNSIGLTISA